MFILGFVGYFIETGSVLLGVARLNYYFLFLVLHVLTIAF